MMLYTVRGYIHIQIHDAIHRWRMHTYTNTGCYTQIEDTYIYRYRILYTDRGYIHIQIHDTIYR